MSWFTRNKSGKKNGLTVRETVVFAMLGSLMYCTKVMMEALPNIHLLGMFIVTFTVVFRRKALVPLYIYVFLEGLFGGFSVWWMPYLYIWTVLWGVTMLLPQNMSEKKAAVVYPAVCCAHGLLFGTLYAPAQAIAFGLSFKQTLAWIAAGLTFDVAHGIGNLFAGLLVLPLSRLLDRIMKMRS